MAEWILHTAATFTIWLHFKYFAAIRLFTGASNTKQASGDAIEL